MLTQNESRPNQNISDWVRNSIFHPIRHLANDVKNGSSAFLIHSTILTFLRARAFWLGNLFLLLLRKCRKCQENEQSVETWLLKVENTFDFSYAPLFYDIFCCSPDLIGGGNVKCRCCWGACPIPPRDKLLLLLCIKGK